MKRKLTLALCSSVVFLSISSGLLASIAWFKIANSVIVGVSGSFVEEYFHCGNGSSEDPFVITRPIHYYHLVEFFQRETDLPAPINADFGIDYLYFQVGYDLDNDGDLEVYNYDNQGLYQGDFEHPSYSETLNMAYYSDSNALMPIGTNEVPFIGSFDGNASEGISISNLSIHCAESVVVDGNQVDRAASDIGIFGYVADEDTGHTKTVIKNSNFNSLTIDLTEASNVVNPSTTSVVHTSTHAGHAYVGYIAGHVHTYTNYNATGPVNASPLYDVYVSNATILGGAGVTCNFGYIGLVDSVDTDTSVTISGEVSSLNGEGGGGGQGNNWGGSINIKELNLRIYNMMNVTTDNGIATDDPSTNHPTATTSSDQTLTETGITTGKTYLSKLTASTGANWGNNKFENAHRYCTDDYNAVSIGVTGTGSASNTALNASPLTRSILYSFEDSGQKTLQFTRSSNPGKGTYTYKTDIPGTMLPLNVGDKSSGYQTSLDNTGYIIGGYKSNAQLSNYYQTRTTVRTAASDIKYIASSTNSQTTYNSNKLEVISNSSATYNASNYGRISDTYNAENTDVSTAMSNKYATRTISSTSLKKYKASRDTLDDILSGASFIHGLHFTGQAISTSYKETLSTAYINGETKTNYELPKHSIDFNLKETGYINFFAGSYQNASMVADSFFSLYTLSRSGSSISNILEISKVYKNNNAATKDEYPHLYLLKNGTTYTTGATTKRWRGQGDHTP